MSGVLSTAMPVVSISRLVMAGPRPVPPYLRVTELSAWVKPGIASLLFCRHADAGILNAELQLHPVSTLPKANRYAVTPPARWT